ncbi:MAG: porin [Pseudomonadota bacterium]
MKKVLFATTALVATAGVAAADVTFGGYGRFGVLYSDPDTGSSSTNITSRLRLQIDMTAETDAGVTLGGRFRLEGEERDARNAARPQVNGARLFARSGGLEVGVGNIFGAIEFMPGMYTIDLGLTGLGYDYTVYGTGGADAYSSGGLGSAGTNGVELIYSAGDFNFHMSASDTNDRIAAHVSYSTGGFTFALGAQSSDSDADTELVAAVEGTIGAFDFGVAYADNGTGGDHVSLMGRVDVGAATNVEFYVADADSFNDMSYGVDFNHDLGGGTSLRGGVASLSSGELRADLGVRFNF